METMCPLCRTPIHVEEKTLRSSCGHVFHGRCFQEVSKESKFCPCCRGALDPAIEIFITQRPLAADGIIKRLFPDSFETVSHTHLLEEILALRGETKALKLQLDRADDLRYQRSRLRAAMRGAEERTRFSQARAEAAEKRLSEFRDAAGAALSSFDAAIQGCGSGVPQVFGAAPRRRLRNFLSELGCAPTAPSQDVEPPPSPSPAPLPPPVVELPHKRRPARMRTAPRRRVNPFSKPARGARPPPVIDIPDVAVESISDA